MKKINNHDNTKKPCIQPPLHHPWLLFRAKQSTTTGYIYSPTSTPYKGFSTSLIPENLNIRKVYNCCYGWLILSTNPETDVFLWNPVLSKLIKLPPLHEVMGPGDWIHSAVLLSPGKWTDHLDPNCMIMIFVNDRHTSRIMFHLVREKHWNSVYYEDKITGFRLPNPIIMNDLVYVQGKVEGGGMKLFCINRIDPAGIVLTEYCTLPSYTLWLKEGYLVESFGELFYIIITTEGFSVRITFVEAFEFDQVNMKWKKVRDVGDRVFFLDGNETYSVLSRSKRGNKGSSLYHCFHYRKSWYSYNFADNSVSTFPLQSTWKLPKEFDQTILYLPDRRLIDEPDFQMNLVETGQYEVDARKIRDETKKCKIYEDDKTEKEFLLLCLPGDLMELIFRILINPVDYLNFRSASKICRLLAPKIEWRRTPINLPYAPLPISPWIVTFNNHSSTYHFVDSEFGSKYLIRAPKSLNNTMVVHSKNGWLLLMSNSCKESLDLSFYNPFMTTDIIKLPKLPSPNLEDVRISFSSSPTTTNCLVVAINSDDEDVEIFTLQVGKKRWNTLRLRFGEYYGFDIIPCPFIHDERVYVLDGNGSLLELKLQNDIPLSLICACSAETPCGFSKHRFLVECDGKLLQVCLSQEGW